jgi:hypothetical protein
MARKPGKYEHLTKTMRRVAGITGEANADPKYQDRVDQTKAAILAAPQDGEEILPPYASGTLVDDVEGRIRMVHQAVLRRCAGRRHGIELAGAYVQARDLKDRITAWLSNTNLLIEAYAQLMVEQMEVEGSHGMDVGGRAVSWHEEPWTKTVDKDAVRNYFLADPDLVRSLNPMWQTLDGLNRKRLLLGEDVVPGTEVWAKAKVRLGGE